MHRISYRNSQMFQSAMKPLKIENWASYILQRLMSLLEKGTKCDAVLQLADGKSFMAHSLILFTCSPYFDKPHHKLNDGSSVFLLPPETDDESLVAILRFMYTGKLDISHENFTRIHKLAKILQMHILVQFLASIKRSPVASTRSPQVPKSAHTADIMKTQSVRSQPMDESPCHPPKPSPIDYMPENRDQPPGVIRIPSLRKRKREMNAKQITKVLERHPDDSPSGEEEEGEEEEGKEEEDVNDTPKQLLPPPVNSKSHVPGNTNSETPGTIAKKMLIVKTPSQNLGQVDQKKILTEIAKQFPKLGGIAKPGSSSSKLKIVERRMSADELRHIQQSTDKKNVAYLVLSPDSQHPKAPSQKTESQSGPSKTIPDLLSMKAFDADWICRMCQQEQNQLRAYQSLAGLRAHCREYHSSKITVVCERCGIYAPKRLSTITAPLIKFDTKFPKGRRCKKCITCRFVVVTEPFTEGESEIE